MRSSYFRYSILLFFVMIATLSVFGQSKDCYELQHDCILCPKQNTWTRHVTGGGYGSIVTEKFDYKKNALIFTGNTFRFEKPAVKRNKDDMKVLYYENSGFIYEDRGQYYACYAPFAVNYPYHLYINDLAEEIAESNGLKRKPKLEYVGKRLFLVDGELFFKGEGLSFFPVKGYDIKFDMPTLRHLAGNYYVDNNGLYWFGTYIVDRGISPDFHTKQLDSSDGKPADIQIGKCYIAYNDKVYSLDRRNLMPLELNPDSMREYNGHIVTDGRNTYIYGNPPTEREKDKYDFTSWQHIISEKIDLRWNEKEKKLFFPDYEWSANTERVSGQLIKSANGYVFIEKGKIIECNSMYVYNQKTEGYDMFDESRYKQLTKITEPNSWNDYISTFHVYDGFLYGHAGCLDISRLSYNIGELTQVKNDFCYTGFYTDGKRLIFILMNNAPDFVYEDVDFQSLKAINPKMLVDKNNIYRADNSKLVVIPRKKLKLNIEVYN